MTKAVSGKNIIHFSELDAESIAKVQAFQAKHRKLLETKQIDCTQIEVTFGGTPEFASIEWKTPEQFKLVKVLARSIGVKIK